MRSRRMMMRTKDEGSDQVCGLGKSGSLGPERVGVLATELSGE